MSSSESRERLAATFEALQGGLAKALVRVPSYPLRLDLVDNPGSSKLAEVASTPPGGCEVRIHGLLLDCLERTIRPEVHALNAACLRGVARGEHDAATENALAAAVLDLAETFTLLHECCHFWCGHWDAVGGGSGLDECELHLLADGSESGPRQSLGAYYLELEADGSAIQLLMLRLDFESLRGLFATLEGLALEEGDSAALFDLNGAHRVIAFRVLLAAIWVVIRLFEDRKTAARAIQPYHPLPSARLLAAVFTVMAQYAELTSRDIDEAGLFVQQLDDDQTTDLQQLLRDVLAPVLTAGWRLSDDADAHEGFRTAPVWIAEEVGRLLLQEPPTTAAGRELSAVQALRAALSKRLGPLRYLPYELP